MNKVKKGKMEKGITLIALIITIVVLLILAVVTINSIQGDGIIRYAQNSSDDYTAQSNQEQEDLNTLLSQIEVSQITWKQEGATLTRTNADGTKTQIKIGDYVNYNEGSYTHTPDTAKGVGTSTTSGSSALGFKLGTSELVTEDLKWRVLGLNEKGEIELISADPTKQKLYLANDEGYVNAEDNLNNFCNELYGQGKDSSGNKLATEARSLKVEDIDNLTNYDKTTAIQYGYKWTFRYPTQEEMDALTGTEGSTRYMQYRRLKPDGTVSNDWTNKTDSNFQTFRLPNEETAISSSNPGSKELESTTYDYSIASNLTADDGFTADEATAISNMITKGTTSSNISQWLSSRCSSMRLWLCEVLRVRY